MKPAALHRLHQQLAALEPQGRRPVARNARGIRRDELTDLVSPDSLHEVLAATPRQAVAAHGFALGLGLATAARMSGRAIVWILQSTGRSELGEPYGPGLAAWGLDPEYLLMVHVRDAAALLAAGEDVLRSGAAAVVIMSGWGESRAHGLTASRRLMMAARTGTTPGLLVRANAAPAPSAAQTRWSVTAARSTPLQAQAPGRPAFRVRLLRSRSGTPPGEWTLEWDRETQSFTPAPASGGLVSLSADRPVEAYRPGHIRAA